MRSFTFLASLVVALPSVLAAVVPTSNNIGRALTAPDADVDVAARLTSSSEALTRRQAEAEPLTLEDINQVIEECKSQGSGGSMDYKCALVDAARAGGKKAGDWVWASVRSNNIADLDGKKNEDWFHITLPVPEDDGDTWSTGHIDFYVFKTGSLEWWMNEDATNDHMVYEGPNASRTEMVETHTIMTWD